MWLIPSFGALFALIGYVVQSAQRSLLGFPTDDGALISSTGDAADFLRYVLTLVGDRLLGLGSLTWPSMGGHGTLLVVCGLTAAAVVAWRLSLWGRNPHRAAAWMLGAVMLALLTAKFVVFDAPVMRIEGVIVGIGVPESTPELDSKPATRSIATRLEELSGGHLDKAISARARQVWRLMVCSRVGTHPLPVEADLVGPGSCSGSELPGKDTDKAMLTGEFDASLLMGVFIAVPAGLLLALRVPLATGAGLLAMAYLLTIPYAYGKLLKPVNFTYALVRIAPGTLVTAKPEVSSAPKVDRLNAFVLTREGGAVTLLQDVPEACSKNGTSTALRFASFPTAKLVSIEFIYRKDVIEWAMRTQRKCPKLDGFENTEHL